MFAKIILAAVFIVGSFAKTAQMTWYESYPRCCKDSGAPNQGECSNYNGCHWAGKFANGETLSANNVKNTPIVSFYNGQHPSISYWRNTYMNRKIRITKNGVTFDAIIKDTCSDNDTKNNECYRNSNGGYLIDIEFWTARRFLGSEHNAHGSVQFEFI